MKIEFKTDSEEKALQLFDSTKGLLVADGLSELDGFLRKYELDSSEVQEACLHGSYYQSGNDWVLYFEFDEEIRKSGDDIISAFTDLAGAKGVSLVSMKSDRVEGSQQVVDFKSTKFTVESEFQSSAHKYTVYFGLEPDNVDYLWQGLGGYHSLKCIEYWHRHGGIDYSDMLMTVGDMDSDGEVCVEDIDNASSALLGLGRWSASRVTLDHSRARSTGFGFIESEILGCLAAAKMEIADKDLLAEVHSIDLCSYYGIAIDIGTNKLFDESFQGFFKNYLRKTKTYQFIEMMYFSLFEKGTSIATSNYETHGFQEPREEKHYFSLTELLKETGSRLSPVKANKLMVEKGILKEVKVRGVKTPKKIFSDDSGIFGINIKRSNKKNDYESRFLIEPFRGLLFKLGE